MKIIGLAGTLNAGKDSLGDMLAEKHGFLHISTSDMIRAMKRKEYGDSPQALLVRNDPYINKLRAERGPGFLIDAVNGEWESKKDKFPGGYVASGIRAIGEVERIHDLGGIMVFVDAEPRTRYNRSISRARDVQDQKTFEQFLALEQSEIDVDPTDKNVQNLVAMKQMADLIIDNNEDSIEEFKNQADKILQRYLM